MRSPRSTRQPRAPRHARSPRTRPAGVLAAPRANRPASELVMIANGTLPWPVDLTDADEQTIALVRQANVQRARASGSPLPAPRSKPARP